MLCMGADDVVAVDEERLRLYLLADVRFLLGVVRRLVTDVGILNADVANLRRDLDVCEAVRDDLRGEIEAIKSGKTALAYPSLGVMWVQCPCCSGHFMLGNMAVEHELLTHVRTLLDRAKSPLWSFDPEGTDALIGQVRQDLAVLDGEGR